MMIEAAVAICPPFFASIKCESVAIPIDHVFFSFELCAVRPKLSHQYGNRFTLDRVNLWFIPLLLVLLCPTSQLLGQVFEEYTRMSLQSVLERKVGVIYGKDVLNVQYKLD